MSSTQSLQYHLLFAAFAAILLLAPAARAMPVSRRTEYPTELPTIASLPEQSSEVSRVEVQDDQDVLRRKRSSCPSEVPSDMIDELKRGVMSEPHPMFLISEMAEMLHRERYNILNLGDCTLNQEALDETKKSVFRTVLGYLNNSGVPSEDDVGCPPSYAISYHPDRYPRYLVQVKCGKKSSKIVPRNELQCSDSPSDGTSRVCEPYHLGDMMYLTTDPPASILCTRMSDTVWYKCRATSVGVGCKFGDPE